MKNCSECDDKAELTARLKGLLKHVSSYVDNAPDDQKLKLLMFLENWLVVDRRRHLRKACFVSVTLGESRESTAFIRNMTTKGAFIETSAAFSAGEHISLMALIPGREKPVEMTGEIVRKTPEGIAVKFTAPPSMALEALVESL